MLRRLIDGAVLIALAWFLLVRLDAGEAVLGLAVAAVIAFTAWRIHRLWRKYRVLRRELAEAEAAKLSEDPKEVERAERILRERHMIYAADMTLMSGFVLGGAASAHLPMAHVAGVGHEGIGGDGAGGFGGGDFGGGFGGGEG